MTERLYYDQTYLSEFDARILEIRTEAQRALVRLDRSAFYPTSGGQPFDTGRLGDARVTDVFVDDAGEVWHQVEGGSLSEDSCVHCTIDWARRFDHMQQHGGEHLLAGMVYRQLAGTTIGLHLGAEFSTIDVTLPDGRTHLSEAELAALEEEVNTHIQEDLPIRCWFPEEAELAALPLRKAPTVTTHVRIVAMGDVEMVACGGTHPSSTGQIGLVKIIDAKPARGKLRLSFVCGMRAVRLFQTLFTAAQGAAAQLSAKAEELPEAVGRMKEQSASLARELSHIKKQQALAQIDGMLHDARILPGGAKLVACQLGDVTPEALKETASALIEHEGVYALLAAGAPLIFARSKDLTTDMGALLRACGARGGGRPEFAQGSAPDAEAVFARASELLA